MKHVSRIAAGLLVVLLLATVCIPMNQGVNAATKPAKITAMFDTTFIQRDAGQEQFLAEYKKLTGIELVVTQPAHNQYHEKMLISFASGDMPDVVEIQPDYPQDYLQLAKEGAIVPLDKFIAKSKAFKKVNKKYLNALKFRGHIYAVPMNSGGGCPTYIRKDWLDNLGLKVPTTYQELMNVARAFTFNDPDRNGKNDTVGYTLPGLDSSMYLQDFYLGAEHDFVKVHGKWVDGFTRPNFKKALMRLHAAYKAKILDQELFTNKTSTAREKFYAGKVGIFPYWAGVWARTFQDNTAANFPKANVIAIPAISGAHYLNRIGPMYAITKACKNPEGVFNALFAYMVDGGEGETLFTYGVEDLHWTKKGGQYRMLPTLSNPNTLVVKSVIDPSLALGPLNLPFKKDEKQVASMAAFNSRKVQLTLPPDSNTYVKYAADINALKKEIMAKVIMGTLTVDQGLKQYKEKSARFNIPKILKEANASK